MSDAAVPAHHASLKSETRADKVRRQGLFPNEAEVARRLSQAPSEWRAKAEVLERDGLPRIDPLMGGRYWPAVLAWWNRRYGISTIEVSQPDGEENLDEL
jgi:hypothetical protein